MRSRVVLCLLVLAGCHALPKAYVERPVPHATTGSALARGLEYLENTQFTEQEELDTGLSWAGTWPIAIRPRVPFGAVEIPDIGSGLPACVHCALCVFRDENARVLGLTPDDLRRARRMRLGAVSVLERFRSKGPDPSSYGWWPESDEPVRDVARAANRPFEAWVVGPRFRGNRAPPTFPGFPSSLRLFADVDDTALALVARLDHASIDGGAQAPASIAHLFEPWRDLPGTSRRAPTWLEPASGAFLTWMAPSSCRAGNDVDLAINTNVLWALARYGELDAKGATEATELVLRAVREGRSRHERHLSIWYPRLVFHYGVARAFACGPVPALAPAARLLAQEVAGEARVYRDGSVSWGPAGPDQAFHTALAILTLIHAGCHSDLVERGCDRLLALQDQRAGGWPKATLTWANTCSGIHVIWRSAAMPTALALEALARARLISPAGRGVEQ